MMKNIQFIKTLLFTLICVALSYTAFNYSIEVLNQFIPIFYGGTGMLALVAMTSISRSESADRSGNATKYRVYLLHYDTEVDVDNVPLPDKTAQTLADIPRISGMYWHYIDANINSVIPKFKTGDDGLAVANEVEVKLGGLKTETRSFLNNYKGENFFIVWEVCSGSQAGKKYIAGTKCSGMTMTITDGGWAAEMTGATIMFKNSCPDIPYEYLGNVTLTVPTAIVADATTRALVTGVNEYKFSANTGAKNFTAFTGMGAADHGRILTLHGAAVDTNATTIDDGDSFILLDGTTWTANPGSRLVVRIYKDGAATYKFIEVENTRIQA